MSQDFFKSSVIYTIIGFLPLSFAFFFTPIYLNYMDASEYGLLNLFVLYSGIVAIIYSLGIAPSFTYLYWDVYKEPEKLKELIANTLGLLIILQVIFICIGLLFGNTILEFIVKSEEKFTFFPYFIAVLIFSAFMVYFEMFQYFFRNQGNLKLFSILSISILVLSTIGTLIGVVTLDLKSVGAILGRSIGYGVIMGGFLAYMIYKYGVSFNLKKTKDILKFSIPLFINALVGAIAYGLDKIMIERFDTIENLGIYGFALVMITILEIWFSSINNALSPTLYKFIKESIHEKTKEIQALSHIIALSVFIVAVVIIALIYPLMDLIIPPDYHKAASFVPILACGFFWRVFTSFESYTLYKEKKTNYLIYNQSSSLLSLLFLGYFAYQQFGILGIVYAVYFVKLIEYLVMKLIANKVNKLPLKLNKFIVITICLSLICFLITIFNTAENNKYVLYLIPFAFLLFAAPVLLNKELRNIHYFIKHRKELF